MRRGTSHRSWASMMRTARAPLGVLAAGGLALTVPPQTRDMLAFLNDTPVWGGLGFLVSLLVLGLSAWYWSRAALAARFGIPDSQRYVQELPDDFGWTAFVWVPRLTLLGTGVLGVVMILLGSRNGPGSEYSVAAGLLSLGAFGFTVTRLPKPDQSARREAAVKAAPEAAGQFGVADFWRLGARLGCLLKHAPWGRGVAVGVLLVGILPFLVGLIDSFGFALHAPNALALLFPGPGIVLLLLGLMIGPLTVLTFVSDGMCWQVKIGGLAVGPRRPPVLLLFGLYVFVAVPYFYQRLHVVRVVPVTETRQDLAALFKAWTRVCGGSGTVIRPVIVDMSGGATRAGLWGAAVLDQVLKARGPDGPALFAVSSVSGGSLGAAAAMSVLRSAAVPCLAPGLAPLAPQRGKTVKLAGDAVGPLLGGWLMDDTPRAIFTPLADPLRRWFRLPASGGDSAQVIEQAFADLWSRAAIADGKPAWSEPYLSLFYDGNFYRAGMPLWLANGTDATTGNRLITSPIKPPSGKDDPAPWPFRGARDFTVLTGADVEIETAINNTARFPYLEPFGNVFDGQGHRVAALIDGGYFENEGIQTALELASWLIANAPPGRTVAPIIVQATADGDHKTAAAQVMHCFVASDGPWVWSRQSALTQILAPIAGLYHVRGGHSAVLLRQAFDEYCKTPAQHFFNFYLPGEGRHDIPLNWVLSDESATFIWTKAFSNRQVDNGVELQRLGVTMRENSM